jgi:DNA-binding transcriptional ArsR family regulator
MSATSMLGALAQETRLEVFRLLVRQGPDGAPAGEIARTLGVPHNTMSSHLSILAHAGLVASRREGRSIIYRVDFEGTRALLAFLLEDCCQGRKDVCRPAVDAALAGCC